MIAVNDSFLLESFCLERLKKYFGHEVYYGDLLELVLNVIQKTEFGQLLDLTSQPLDVNTGGSKMDLDRFTLERYSNCQVQDGAFFLLSTSRHGHAHGGHSCEYRRDSVHVGAQDLLPHGRVLSDSGRLFGLLWRSGSHW
jgi:hypothetical protein